MYITINTQIVPETSMAERPVRERATRGPLRPTTKGLSDKVSQSVVEPLPLVKRSNMILDTCRHLRPKTSGLPDSDVTAQETTPLAFEA
jgi:hypothetical protein